MTPHSEGIKGVGGSITHTCGCTNPDRAYLVEYEAPNFDADEGFLPGTITASMCELHALRQLALGDVVMIHRLDK